MILIPEVLEASSDLLVSGVWRKGRQLVAEILHNIQSLPAPDHRESRDVVSGIQQVLAMRRGMHQYVLNAVHSFGHSNVFSGTVQMKARRLGNALSQGGLAGKLMGELLLRHHRLIVSSGGVGEASVDGERGDARLYTGLVGQV